MLFFGKKRKRKSPSATPTPRANVQPTLETLENRLVPATYHVTGFADGLGSVTATEEPDTFEATTLRAAVLAANASTGDDDTIVLSTGTYELSAQGSGDLGDLDITDDLTITGEGAQATHIDAAPLDDRVLEILGQATKVSISNVTVRNGSVVHKDGGGIRNEGNLTLSHTVIMNNRAVAANQFGDAKGGGIHNSGTLTLNKSTVADNQANGVRGGDGLGGGIYNSGTLLVKNSTLSHNEANGGGSDFDDGGSGLGGGIYNDGGASVTNSTLSGNIAKGSGSQTADGGDGIGGGIYNRSGLTIANSTILENHTVAGSGNVDGVGDGGGVADTTAQQTQVVSTIIAKNVADTTNPDVSGDFASAGHNLIGVSESGSKNGFDEVSDMVGTTGTPIDPMLTALQDNGGPTETHAPLSGSVAIGNGVDPFDLGTDQRGYSRTFAGSVDIGAVETVATKLANAFGFYVDAHGFFQSSLGENEKWLRGKDNSFSNSWYFLTENGDLYEWDGTSNLTGKKIATLGPEVHRTPERLFQASDAQLSAAEATQAETLDQTHDLHVSESGYQQNSFNGNEKWLRGNTNSHGNEWYFVLPDGKVFEWDGTAGTLSGTELFDFDSILYLQSQLLHEAFEVQLSAGEAAAAKTLDETAGLYVDVHGFHENVFGGNEKWLRGKTNSHGNEWYYILPDGKVFEWDGTDGTLSGNQLGAFAPLVHTHLVLLHEAFEVQLDAAQTNVAGNLDDQYGFHVDPGGLYANIFGGDEKWLRGEENSFGNHWYFLLPDGQLFEWDGSGDSLTGNVLFHFDVRVYRNPELLYQAAH